MADKPKSEGANALNPLKYSFVDSKAKWNSDGFYKAYEALQDLAKAEASDPKGLEKILSIVNNPGVTSGWSREQAEAAKQKLVSQYGSTLFQYSVSNIGDLAKAAGAKALDVFLHFPAFEAKDDKDYAGILSFQKKLADKQAQIQKDPQAYIESRIPKDLASRQFWGSMPQLVLEGEIRPLEMHLRGLAAKYGPAKAIATNVKAGTKLHEVYTKEVGVINDKYQKARQEKAKAIAQKEGKERELTATEENVIEAQFAKEREALGKKYEKQMPALAKYQEMIMTLQAEAYQVMKEDKERKEAEKKAKEKAMRFPTKKELAKAA